MSLLVAVLALILLSSLCAKRLSETRMCLCSGWVLCRCLIDSGYVSDVGKLYVEAWDNVDGALEWLHLNVLVAFAQY